MRTISLTLSILLLIGSGCKKDNSNAILAEAVIRDAGSPASDGCGWLIEIGDTTYSPAHLDENYQINNQEISIEYEPTGEKYGCGYPTLRYYDVIKIKRIKVK
ncbi:hypothetical protein B0I27_1114 [Arcticibacter pallidicorallinus]|uniref:Lipoprotein n=1 Tax=Arcticibacter pallidicorallinus TaxID=1259464 RepID=A0A2T0TV94_9SPHI|nr:hypothetical protein [Arcticibacter pallidicorallinus]PRY49448.1 hypothetical protein B0I27_1114 [Arcticibacter pallidicorallinus]